MIFSVPVASIHWHHLPVAATTPAVDNNRRAMGAYASESTPLSCAQVKGTDENTTKTKKKHTFRQPMMAIFRSIQKHGEEEELEKRN